MIRILFKFIIYPSCERTLKNETVKSKIIRKSSFGDIILFDFIWWYMITFHLFSVLCQRRYYCWNIESELATWKIITIMQRWKKKARINFSVSPYSPCCFLEKKNQIFLSSFFSFSLRWRSWLYYECERISALKYCKYHTGHLLAFPKRP